MFHRNRRGFQRGMGPGRGLRRGMGPRRGTGQCAYDQTQMGIAFLDAYKVDPRQGHGLHIFDTAPEAPFIRAQSARQALYDVMRVARAAAAENPDAKSVILKWTPRLTNPEKWAPELMAILIPWGATGSLVRNFTWKTRPGKAVLIASEERRIANAMQDVYKEGATDLDDAGSPDWAGVLWDAYLTMGGIEERAEDIAIDVTVKKAGEDVIDYGPGAIVAAIALVGAAVIGVQLLKS